MTGMGDAFGAQLRAAKAEGELARIMDALREFAEENGLNPEMEPRDLLAKAAGAFRSCAAVSDARYAEIQGLRAEMEAMRPRLMPEGMEWPCFDDGEPVRIGDEYADTFGANTVATIEVGYGYSAINSNTPGGYVVGKFEGAHGRYVPRPAPKVLDADGMEIRKGDTVYQMGCKYRVSHLHGANDYVRIVYENSGRWVDPKTLTHRAPVLASDGKPLREGETVWHEEDGTQLRVTGFGDEEDGETIVKVERISGKTDWSECRSLSLNHEQPDSWERWREEWQWPPVKYCERILGVEYDHDTKLDEAFAAQGKDLERRAKKLAGVE